MKAYIEIDMPESCRECDLYSHKLCTPTLNNVSQYKHTRHENCPLKEVEKE